MDPKEISLEEAERIFNELHDTPTKEIPPVEETPGPEVIAEVENEPSGKVKEVEEAPEKPPVQQAAHEEEEPWINKIDNEELRAKVKAEIEKAQQLEHRIKSDDGRVAAFQRKAEELKRELQKFQQKPMDIPSADSTFRTPEEWKKVIEHDPELAKAVEALVRSDREKQAKEIKDAIAAAVAPINEDRLQQHVRHELELLERVVPGHKDIKESEMFKGWLEYECPPMLKKAWDQSYDHRDYVAVYNQFAVDMINSGRVRAPEEPPASVQHNNTAVDPDKASTIAAERERKLQQTPVGTKAPILPSTAKNKGPMGVPGGEVTLESAEELFRSLFK